MKLYIMRHGPAEDNAATGRDADRALTPSGRDRVRSVAKLLVQEQEAPLVILTSPLVRAIQTAEIVASVTAAHVETHRELGTGSASAPLPLLRQALKAKRKRVMIVGHEPDLSALVAHFVGRPPEQGMTKAMVVGVSLHLHASPDEADDVAPSSSSSSPRQTPAPLFARLRFVLDPKELVFHPDART